MVIFGGLLQDKSASKDLFIYKIEEYTFLSVDVTSLKSINFIIYFIL
jgi:hypothetical protein